MSITWLHNPTPDRACTVIGEVAQTHDGSLGVAHAFIDVIADAGADAVKFQTHIAHAESTPAEQWRVQFSKQDATRYAYWKRMEFTKEQWGGLKEHAENRGLLFLSSPFSPEAFDLLSDVGVAGWKLASGETSSVDILTRAARSGLPVMLSTGMSSLDEIDKAVELLRREGVGPLAVMQCTSMYPTPPEQVGLNVIELFRGRYDDCAVGLSDHSATIFPGLAAATLGAQVLEVHVTMSRNMFGPDVVASLTQEELRALVGGVRFIEDMRRHPVDKSKLPESVVPLRSLFKKSAVACNDLPAGTILGPRHFTFKKPGTGIPLEQIDEIIGRKLCRALRRDELILFDDLEPV